MTTSGSAERLVEAARAIIGRVAEAFRAGWLYVTKHRIWSAVFASLLTGIILWATTSSVDLVGGGSGSARTSVKAFYGADKDYSVIELQAGECWTASLSTGRVDSWRCKTNDRFIHDPCFDAFGLFPQTVLPLGRRAVICPFDPRWLEGTVAIQFDPSHVDFESRGQSLRIPSVPWFFTAGRYSCHRLTGANPEPLFEELPFECSEYSPGSAPEVLRLRRDTNRAVVVCSEPEEVSGQWSSRCVYYGQTGEVSRLQIDELWY